MDEMFINESLKGQKKKLISLVTLKFTMYNHSQKLLLLYRKPQLLHTIEQEDKCNTEWILWPEK